MPLLFKGIIMTRNKSTGSLLGERDTADYLGVTDWWLQKQRSQGTGPAYIRIGGRKGGGIRYRVADLEQWIEANRILGRDVGKV